MFSYPMHFNLMTYGTVLSDSCDMLTALINMKNSTDTEKSVSDDIIYRPSSVQLWKMPEIFKYSHLIIDGVLDNYASYVLENNDYFRVFILNCTVILSLI